MKDPQMAQIADFMTRIVENLGNEEIYAQVHQEVKALAAAFPMPQFK